MQPAAIVLTAVEAKIGGTFRQHNPADRHAGTGKHIHPVQGLVRCLAAGAPQVAVLIHPHVSADATVRVGENMEKAAVVNVPSSPTSKTRMLDGKPDVSEMYNCLSSAKKQITFGWLKSPTATVSLVH